MDIRFSKKFVKQYGRLAQSTQQKFDERLLLWKEQPTHPLLNHHRLSGALNRFNSINVTGDVRALYQIIDKCIVIFELIGTHSQLHG